MWHPGPALAWLVLAGASWAQVTERVSLTAGGGRLPAPPGPVVAAGGRFVVFITDATDIVPGDWNGTWDVFVRDRVSNTTGRVSVATGGAEGSGASGTFGISISADGRYVAFESRATDLVPGDFNAAGDIFVRDRSAGTTERVSVGRGGAEGNAESSHPWISPDGRYVAFSSRASDLVAADTNNAPDVFVHDRATGRTERVSVATGGGQADRGGDVPSLSANGRFVAFQSLATDLVPGDTNARTDVFVRDRSAGTTERVSVDSLGAQANGNSVAPSIAADGCCVAFSSLAGNLVPGDANGSSDVFVRNLENGTTERASVATGGAGGNASSVLASISGEGRFVAFASGSSNLVPGDTGWVDIFIRDHWTGTTERVSLTRFGRQADGNSATASISADGRFVAFQSAAANLAPGDTNGSDDVFLRDRYASSFESVCDAGMGGVIPCPCSNPAPEPGRGCENSEWAGGAALSASGVAYLSLDSLVLTASGEVSSAPSLLIQASAAVPGGIAFGQGVRCAGGTLLRLYVKIAVGGIASAPDFGAGDPSVSSRSASLGDLILPGQDRWYFMFYRDPVVSGGCPASSAFNATQTGRVTWWM